jgi:predicted DNA-binding transcriptional regulator AlpA
VSRSFFYERILNPGLIQPVRLGRSVRIRPSDLEALVERLVAEQVQA